MPTLGRLSAIVHWLALSAWISALVTAAISAMHVFGTLPELGLHLPDYSALSTEEQGRIAGGMVMIRVFSTVDRIQVVCALLLLASMLAMVTIGRVHVGRWPLITRSVCMIGAVLVLAYHTLVLSPRMNGHLQAYWRAAAAHDDSAATDHRMAFDADHPIASRLYFVTLVLLVLTASIAAAGSAGNPKSNEPHSM